MHEIRLTSFRAVFDNPLLIAEYEKECSLFEMGGINPNLKVYEQLENSGAMYTFAAYVADEVVGFATVMVYEVPHYSKKVATTESLFIAAGYRPSGIGTLLMKNIEDFAILKGCKAFFYSAPVDGQLDKLLSMRKRGRHSNNVYLVTL